MTGQKRTMRSTCGWGATGQLNEVNKKFLIHRRHCKECKESNVELPEWNMEEALNNGFNGISNGKKVNKINTVAYIDGERQDLLIKGVSDVNGKIMTSLLPSVLDRLSNQEKPPILTKSQKKRLMKKNKKAREELKEDNTKLNDEQVKILLIVIDCNVTKEDAINVLKVKYPEIHKVVVNDDEWNLYYDVYLELKNYNVDVMDL
jgi:hypothetical protein